MVPDAAILAKMCVFSHVYNPSTTGQNLWLGGTSNEDADVRSMIQMFYNERYDKKWQGHLSHYTQVMYLITYYSIINVILCKALNKFCN